MPARVGREMYSGSRFNGTTAARSIYQDFFCIIGKSADWLPPPLIWMRGEGSLPKTDYTFDQMRTDQHLHLKMIPWLQQASAASGFLGRLYTELKDPLQKKRAITAGGYCREQCRRIQPRITHSLSPWIGRPEAVGERAAWQVMIETLLGLTMLVALGQKASILHHRLDHELKTALQGFTTAFPNDTVEQDLDKICERVIRSASEIAGRAWSEVRCPEEVNVDVRVFLQDEWSREIRPNLMAFVRGLTCSGGPLGSSGL